MKHGWQGISTANVGDANRADGPRKVAAARGDAPAVVARSAAPARLRRAAQPVKKPTQQKTPPEGGVFCWLRE